MIKLLLLINSLSYAIGNQSLMELKLSDSYENQIFSQVTGQRFGHSIEEYRREFQALNLKVEYIEVKHEIAVFNDTDAFKDWIYSQVGDKAELVFNVMQTIPCSDGKIRFPTKKIIVIVCES